MAAQLVGPRAVLSSTELVSYGARVESSPLLLPPFIDMLYQPLMIIGDLWCS
jgi:hypothetical protein